ncbi:hypothetical protein ACQ4PT_038483 [Festuca glaucescens]
MVLGIPFDYRNDYDISNAVAAFGKYHHWHQDDAFKERTMIFVTFDSPASVPRDIVFGNYANIGDVKETWTAPFYVLGADFADVLPVDEDQMPLDGNPHPLPVIPKPLNSCPIKSAFLFDQELLFKGTLSLSLGLAHGINMTKVLLPRRRQVARLLDFDEANTAEQAHEMEPPVFTASPAQSEIKKKRGRAKKTEPAVVDTAYRRSTRSCTKRDGHKPVSMSDTVARPRKKGKVQKKKITEDIPALTAEAEQVANEQHEADENTVQIPLETPVHVMQ